MGRPVKIRILGSEYLIRSDGDEEEVRRIAEYIKEKFESIGGKSEGISEKKALILVAFHIAGDYFQVLEERDRLLERIQARTRELNGKIQSIKK